MVCIQDFNQGNYLKDEVETWRNAIHNGCFSAVPVSFAGAYLHHADIHIFFRMMNSSEGIAGQQGALSGIGPGLRGFTTILQQHGLEWEGAEYDPLVFLRTYHREAFVLCGFYLKEKNKGHAIAFFTDPQPSSDSLYIFDPNHGLFRGDSGYSFADQLEYYLLSKYPDIDPGQVSFRNVRRTLT